MLLADAFGEFIAAAARLESSYGELQAQVAELGHELAERNAALNASLAENERIRLALAQIVDSMPCGILVFDTGGELAMVNPEALELLGLERSSATTIQAISEQAGIDLATLATDERVPEGEQEFCLQIPEAGKRWIEVRNRRLYGGLQRGSRQQARRSGQVILILRDVTAYKQAELERERARRASALAEIAAMLAHEIRNPLASLELFAGLLADSEALGAGTGGEQLWLGHMRAGIRSLAGTVNNVLAFHGAGFPSLTPLDLAQAVESAVAFVRPIADQAGIALSLHCEARDLRILGNAGGLQQLLLNLISNSVRHTAEGGSIDVRLTGTGQGACSGAGTRATLAVTDTGSGIRPEHLPEIFRAGFSGAGNTSGLGLPICAQIVRQHGGEIHVASQAGRGSTFSVELPTL